MGTDNQRMVVIYCDELKELIRSEVEKFRDVFTVHIREQNADKQLDGKPLNIQQVAERYGVSKATIHNWMKQGIIEGFKQGKGRYFYLHELDQRLTRYKYFEMLQNTGEIPTSKRYMEYHDERKESERKKAI
jgi:transcriptional antiterminator